MVLVVNDQAMRLASHRTLEPYLSLPRGFSPGVFFVLVEAKLGSHDSFRLGSALLDGPAAPIRGDRINAGRPVFDANRVVTALPRDGNLQILVFDPLIRHFRFLACLRLMRFVNFFCFTSRLCRVG